MEPNLSRSACRNRQGMSNNTQAFQRQTPSSDLPAPTCMHMNPPCFSAVFLYDKRPYIPSCTWDMSYFWLQEIQKLVLKDTSGNEDELNMNRVNYLVSLALHVEWSGKWGRMVKWLPLLVPLSLFIPKTLENPEMSTTRIGKIISRAGSELALNLKKKKKWYREIIKIG